MPKDNQFLKILKGEEDLNRFLKQNETCIVYIYEQWCQFSAQGLQIFKKFVTNENFKSLNLPIGFLDTHEMEEFKQYEGIEKVPRIWLFKKGTKINFEGEINEQQVFDFILEKVEMDGIPEINDAQSLAQKIEEQQIVFLFFGDKEGSFKSRFHLFAEGHYHHPSTLFFTSNNPYVSSHFKLKKDKVYMLKKGKEPKEYNKAYKREKFLNWLTTNIYPQIKEVEDDQYQKVLSKHNPYFVLIFEELIENTFMDALENEIENFEILTCNKSSPQCQKFLEQIPLNNKETLNTFIISFSQNRNEPLFYTLRDELTEESFIQFIKDFKTNKIRYETFSEDINIAEQTGQNITKISRNSLREFFIKNSEKDIVVLFYDSTKNQQYLNHYEKVVVNYLQVEDHKQYVIFSSYDVSKNSHELFDLKGESIIRMFKHGSIKNHVDFEIRKPNFGLDLKNFLEDASTDFLELEMGNSL